MDEVQFRQRLPHAQRCETGRRALGPALLHDLHNTGEDLWAWTQTQTHQMRSIEDEPYHIVFNSASMKLVSK